MGVQHAMLLKDETRAALRAGRMSIRIDYPYLSANLVLWLIYKEVHLRQAPYMPGAAVQFFRASRSGKIQRQGAK